MNQPTGLERVKGFLATRGIDAKVVELEASARTSHLAAKALGCTVGEIAKSVVFSGEKTVVIVLSGTKRVDLDKIAPLVGKRPRVATAEEVKSLTGYVAGGVPPFPHNRGIETYPDVSLTAFTNVWAASGEQNAVMQISVRELIENIGNSVVDVSQ